LNRTELHEMIAAHVEDRNGMLGEYLEHLQSMALELEKSMQAIASNSIVPLEDSVANQQALAARLSSLARDLSQAPAPTGSDVEIASEDEGLMLRVRGAADKLQNLNQTYAALLKHSSHSVGLMVSLFRSFQGQMQEDSGSGSKQQTWSCQM
jgi:hypothetical protein